MPDNVLLLTIDSLRLDAMPGGGQKNLPEIEALSQDGVEFSNAFATGPGTTPSFPALLTGTLPLSHDGLGPLTDERPRVSRYLSEAGLTTAAFQCNPFLSKHFNYDVGYDTFEDYQNPLMGIATKIFPRGIEINNPKLRRIDERLHLTDAIKKTYQLVRGKPRPYVSAEVITDDTVEWLGGAESGFFCWTHYMDVHHPCFPPEQYRKRFDVDAVTQSEVAEWYSNLLRDPESLTESEIDKLRRLYDAAIAYTDDQISRIIDTLKESGKYEDTLIVFTSDHGELFGEYGEYGKPERMYDELIHVPLVVVNGPDYIAAAADDLVSLLDVPPLIHDTLGLDIPDSYEGQLPGVDTPRQHILAEHEVEGEVVVGARSSEWLYEVDQIRDEHRAFTLEGEEWSTIDPENPGADQVREVVLNRLAELDTESKRLENQVDGEIEERLEDLGYL